MNNLEGLKLILLCLGLPVLLGFVIGEVVRYLVRVLPRLKGRV